MEGKDFILQVQDPDPTHVGRNIVTLDKQTKTTLKITSGDIVEIEGSKKTAAIVWPARSEDEGRNIIRMDSFIRHNAGVGLGEKVKVRKSVPKEAKRVVLAPIEEVRIIASGYERILKKSFLGRPLTIGDNVWVSVFGSGFIYKVVDTQPRTMVKVTDTTLFSLKEKPVKDALEGIPRVAYEDIGGLSEQVKKVREMVELPMKHPELFQKLGIVPPKGILLYGPPGTGKTLLAKAVANEAQVHFISVSAPEVMGKFVGEAEERVRKIFQEAEENAPSIIFIDEMDSIASKRDEVVGEVERRVVAQLLSLMDGLSSRGEVVVMAATNRINSIDEALRRPGRFDREIEFGIPDKKARNQILSIHTRGMPLAKDYSALKFEGKMSADEKLIYDIIKANKTIDASSILPIYNPEAKTKLTIHQLWKIIKEMAEKKLVKKSEFDLSYFGDLTHGFVGADLEALTKEAAMKSLRRYLPEIEKVGEDEPIPVEILETLKINKADFIEALKDVQPSGLREFTIEVPNIHWEDIGSLVNVKEELKQAIEWPLKKPHAFKEMGIVPPKGVLLYGPPGTGKTMLAKAIATESEANFISIKGPELLSMWVGESEKGIRKIFRRARQVAPCIIFFDEIDAIATKRGSGSGNNVSERVVNQLLTEVDGVEPLHNVIFIAATNRPDLIDNALLRPGRIDKLIMVPAPDQKSREAILKVHTRNVKLDKGVIIKDLAVATQGFSGADLEGMVREAALLVLQENNLKPFPIKKEHFEKILNKMKPTIDETSEKAYDEFKENALDFRPSYVR
ncbi:MAG: CDC48 family AAA ATPase [Candidatus Diapherotrites archaeon]|uniref:CDC48 family AAA ATPase n=1 Tax=Candidatus Iainarchaeum sp. TaxID=3101447 RepID=A0A8T5GFK7_9ARCH|nr:CDC48 family AAA ATPase [Candidatus Diapherotrites archaeon]MBT7241004.1 CDC48 family AAA ATPase [Candidatus Diapherotrites archaeon]